MKSFLLLLVLSLTTRAEILRLSHVVPEAGEGITRFEISYGDLKEMVFVKDQPIVTKADVATASPSLSREDSVSVSLTDEGGKKMLEATKAMRLGVDRIAIIVDRKVKTAPVVMSIVNKNLEISGLNDPDEPQKLAARLTGKSEDEIAKILAESKKLASQQPAQPEPVFHTDEEYKKLKTEREKMGLHYLDKVYTEAELDQLLKKGMSEPEVIALFGKPYLIESKETGKKFTFQTAPEKHPATKEFHLSSFFVVFTSEKVSQWKSSGWTDRTREQKRAHRKPDNLIHKAPAVDLSSEDFDYVTFVEKYEISLKPGETTPTIPDYYDLLSILWLAALPAEEGQTIDSSCDTITFLKPMIPDLDVLVQKAPKGRITLTELKKILEPYLDGSKSLKE